MEQHSTEHYLAEADYVLIPLAAMAALQTFRKYHGVLAGRQSLTPAGCSKSSTFHDLIHILMIYQCVGQVYCVPACEECIPCWQVHHHSFDCENPISERASR